MDWDTCVERQVDKAVAQQPAVPVQQPGGAPAAAAATPPPPPPPPAGPASTARGRQLQRAGGPSPPAPYSRTPRAGGAALAGADRDAQRGNPAGEENPAPPPPPYLLLTGACPGPAPRSGRADPSRARLRSAPCSRARASPLRPLTLSAQAEPTAAAPRTGPEAGTCGGPRARPRLARRSGQQPGRPAARAPGGREAGAPEGGRARGRGYSGSRASASSRPAGLRRPSSNHLLSGAALARRQGYLP